MMLQQVLESKPNVSRLIEAVLKVQPEHVSFLSKSLGGMSADTLNYLEDMADFARKVIGPDTQEYARHYCWVCEQFKEEQLYFQRHKKYRLSDVKTTQEKFYHNDDYMNQYIAKGIFLSQFLWANHARSFHLFGTEFLPKNPPQFKHLDIGSGHGLFLAIAAQTHNFSELHAWDISQSSLDATRKALAQMDIQTDLFVKEQDLLDNSGIENEFDSVICSEVLEHTEDPEAGLRHIYQLLKRGGRAYINIPINSPAPDHIFLWRKTDEVRDLFLKCGFEIQEFHELPASGISLERAKKFDFDISCIGILKKPL